MSLFSKWFEKHDWELIDTQMMPSAYEQLSKAGQKLSKCYDSETFFQKCLVQTFKCKLTGEVRIERTYNP